MTDIGTIGWANKNKRSYTKWITVRHNFKTKEKKMPRGGRERELSKGKQGFLKKIKGKEIYINISVFKNLLSKKNKKNTDHW